MNLEVTGIIAPMSAEFFCFYYVYLSGGKVGRRFYEIIEAGIIEEDMGGAYN